MTQPVVEAENDSTASPLELVGRFLVEERGYSIVNEEGQVIAYFDRIACFWNVDVRKLNGHEVKMILFPGGEISLVACSP